MRSIRTLRLPSAVVDACDRHLRQENYNPSRDAALSEAAESKTEADRLAGEVKSLQAERKQVRGRLEKLLSQIDQLNA